MAGFLSRTRCLVDAVVLVSTGAAAVAVSLIAASGATAAGAESGPGTRVNPYPRGQRATIEKFAISVVAVDTNAWPRLEKLSPRNVAPRPGNDLHARDLHDLADQLGA